MKKLIILVIVTMIILLVFVIGGLAKPEYHINEKIELFGLTFYNSCTCENIVFNVTWHLNDSLVFDSSGGAHYKIHDNVRWVGIGQLSGKEYIAISTLNGVYNVKEEEFPFELIQISTQPIISKGEETNQIIKIWYRMVVNANGDVSVDIYKFESVCVGQNP
jgi:hypothetical protein